MSAYRGEVTGIYTSIFILNQFCKYRHIQGGTVTLGCDGLSALQQAFAEELPLSSDTPCYDQLVGLHRLQRESPLTWVTTHIAGHQDDTMAYEELDRMAQLNVQADAIAKSHIKVAKQSPCHFLIYNVPWAVWHNNSLVQDYSTIYDIVHSKQAVTYWESKEKIEPGIIGHID